MLVQARANLWSKNENRAAAASSNNNNKERNTERAAERNYRDINMTINEPTLRIHRNMCAALVAWMDAVAKYSDDESKNNRSTFDVVRFARPSFYPRLFHS